VADAPKPQRKFNRAIIEGPIGPAVWMIAWPTMLQNVIAGLQGIIDHAMVGNIVGFTGNAAIGVSWQIVLVVIVFISSLFTGMGAGVASLAPISRQGEPRRLPAFLTAVFMAIFLAIIGYFARRLLRLINGAPGANRRCRSCG
jgi:Na+-driven multidrug efflux pump